MATWLRFAWSEFGSGDGTFVLFVDLILYVHCWSLLDMRLYCIQYITCIHLIKFNHTHIYIYIWDICFSLWWIGRAWYNLGTCTESFQPLRDSWLRVPVVCFITFQSIHFTFTFPFDCGYSTRDFVYVHVCTVPSTYIYNSIYAYIYLQSGSHIVSLLYHINVVFFGRFQLHW